jgi:hypothetical protein
MRDANVRSGANPSIVQPNTPGSGRPLIIENINAEVPEDLILLRQSDQLSPYKIASESQKLSRSTWHHASPPRKGTPQDAPDADVGPKPDGVMDVGSDTNKRVAKSWQRAAMKANPKLDSAKLRNITSQENAARKIDQGMARITQPSA